jgi:hypothetical protein
MAFGLKGKQIAAVGSQEQYTLLWRVTESVSPQYCLTMQSDKRVVLMAGQRTPKLGTLLSTEGASTRQPAL